MSRQSEVAQSEAVRRYARALAHFGRRVFQVAEDQWPLPTPCTEWSVRDVVNHLVSEQLWVPELLAGATVQEVGDRFDGDVLGSDPAATWSAAEAAACDAFAVLAEGGGLDRTVHLSYGDTSALAYCRQMTSDATVHAWDLTRALGGHARLPEDLVEAALAEVTPYAHALSATGLFAPAVEVAPGASRQTELLALLGRRTGWRPPGA
ncbi:TIGR03086 family metal-binding protein [Kitasatospora sp. MAP5-34]|uniref:TIGR03086 family metal-binding protein n=1 Tax=Kitasatospora sp. MAP5-34 TaxID=3035102 RepID=UPI002476DE79|nr:TIGR03086 family metal-binding protein [Kitasatospora sp. MAP5-34]MDH6577900.1 uncharacterized protein (TIGR03086 family) [Kitasatospora sp. MAP5-34]